MRTETILITPKLAQVWLEQNHANRPQRPSHVHFLAREMSVGQWQLTHQGIAFDVNGALVDGQHRLWAVIEANKSVTMQVTYDVPINRFVVIDRGLPRTLGDVTGIPEKLVQIYNFLLSSVYTKSTTKQSPSDITTMHKYFGEISAALYVHCNNTAKYYSCVGMKAAAVISVLNGEKQEYVFDIYKNLIALNGDRLPRVAFALVKYFERERPTSWNITETRKIYIRGMYVFAEANKDKSRVFITPETADKYMAIACKIIEKALRGGTESSNKNGNDIEKFLLKQRLTDQTKATERALKIAVHNQQEAARSK